VIKPFRSFEGGNMNSDGSFQDTVVSSSSSFGSIAFTYKKQNITVETDPEDIGIVADGLSEEELKKLDGGDVGGTSLAGATLTIVDMKKQQSLNVGGDDGFDFEIQFSVNADFTGRIKRIRIKKRRVGSFRRRAVEDEFVDVDELCGGETTVDADAGTVRGVACGPGTYILVEPSESSTTRSPTTSTTTTKQRRLDASCGWL
jgi:hypothetical protein